MSWQGKMFIFKKNFIQWQKFMKLPIEITNGSKKFLKNADNGKLSTESLEILMRTVLIMSRFLR